MQDNLVIVESPAKAKTIEKFLGKDFKVMSSYGHIRDLKKKELSIDLDTFEPCYEIPEEKKPLVTELRRSARDAKMVWLASDEDREGEAISWHLCEVLGLDEKQTNRIVFHEITKPAIVHAIETPRHLDMNLVNAQQARRVLDRLVGFGLSPVLWRKVKPSLSAGRVQSVALRLIVEREREVKAFKSEPFYRINALFTLTDAESKPVEVKAELNHRFATHEEAQAFLEACRGARFRVSAVAKHPVKRSPAPPFTTSTLQQEAARKLGFSVSQTMMVAQRLYEAGNITYMRTDSVNLSSLAINTSKEEIVGIYGEDYSKPRQFHTHSKGAQEAHEAIRPTYMSNKTIEGTQQERRLYELVWKRTLASQMADAELEKTTVNIDILPATDEAQDCVEGHHFVAQGEVTIFDGFMKVYRESSDDESADHTTNILPPVKDGDELQRREITSTERFSLAPARYTEASLVRKMEELGIGRPSTYAPTISTIQQREYVEKGDRKGQERIYRIDTLKDDEIVSEQKTEMAGADKGKLIPTDVGTVVTEFLLQNFPDIMDYNFTARVEQQFDKIAEGKDQWREDMRTFYAQLEPEIEKVMNERNEHRVGERQLGEDPQSGKPVSVKIGRYGPVVQIGTAGDEEKPRFAQLPADKSISTITLDEALELFKLPRPLGTFEGSEVTVGTGRFGPYVRHEGKYVSIPKGTDPLSITLQDAIVLIAKKRKQEEEKHLKKFDDDLEIINGHWGPYIAYKGKNYRIPKNQRETATDLTLEQCMEIVNNAPEPKAKVRKKRS